LDFYFFFFFLFLLFLVFFLICSILWFLLFSVPFTPSTFLFLFRLTFSYLFLRNPRGGLDGVPGSRLPGLFAGSDDLSDAIDTVWHAGTPTLHSPLTATQKELILDTRKQRTSSTQTPRRKKHRTHFMSNIENLKTFDPFAEADDDTGEVSKQEQNYIHIRIQQRNGRKTLTTVQGLPKKFDQKKILKVIKKKFACNGTIVNDEKMGEVIQLQGDQRKDVQEFLTDKKEGLDMDPKTIKVHGF